MLSNYVKSTWVYAHADIGRDEEIKKSPRANEAINKVVRSNNYDQIKDFVDVHSFWLHEVGS